MTPVLLAYALAILAVAVGVFVFAVRVDRLEKRVGTLDRTLGEGFGVSRHLRDDLEEVADDVERIYEWAQQWAAADEQADRSADEALPVPDPLTGRALPTAPPSPEQAAAEQAALDVPIGSDDQADDVVDAEIACGWEPAPGVAWPTSCDYPNGVCRGYGSPGCSMKAEENQPIPDLAPGPDGRLEVADPPTREIPRVGAHRSDARATRAAGRALRQGEESTR